MTESNPTCPDCGASLKLGGAGAANFWSCPAGHGLGFTVTAAYGRVEEDEIRRAWHASEDAPPSSRHCPMCGGQMVSATFGVDADEADEGAPGDTPDTAQLTIDVCRLDEMFWLAPGELDELPHDLPNPAPSDEEMRKLAAVRKAFDEGLDEAEREQEEHGVMNRLANTVVRRHPGFVSLLDHAMYGHTLDDMRAEDAEGWAEAEAGAEAPSAGDQAA